MLGSTFPSVIAGVVGVIRWQDYNAAAIHGYTVTWSRTKRTWSLRATVVLGDAFKLSMRPLHFVARTKHSDLEWTIDTMTFQGLRGPLTAALSHPQERRR